MNAAGFTVEVKDVDNVTPTARKLGVPDNLRSCHTAQIGGYAIEGHVPAADIKRLLAERPKAAGIAVPGMVMGSPGMEHGDHKQCKWRIRIVHTPRPRPVWRLPPFFQCFNCGGKGQMFMSVPRAGHCEHWTEGRNI